MTWRSVAVCAALATVLSAVPAAFSATLDDARELHREGKLDDALAAYQAVTQTTADAGDTAVAHNNACVILMNRGDFRAARAQCTEARRLRESLGDDLRLARTLNNLGTVLEALGDYEEAEAMYRHALQINERSGDLLAQTINWSNLGVLAMRTGQFSKALQRHDAARQIALENPGEDWAEQQRLLALVNRGVVLEKLGSYREALAAYLQATAGGAQLDAAQLMALNVNVGVVYRNLGDPVRALAAFRKAIEVGEHDTAAAANAWLNIAIVQHLNLANPSAAETAVHNSLRLARQSGEVAEEIQGLYYLGRIQLQQHSLSAARETFMQCLGKAQASGSREGRWSALEGLARVHLAQGEHATALDYVEQAISLFEAVRSELSRTELRQTYFADKRAVYALAVTVLWQLENLRPGEGHAARAFLLAQQAKARELLEAMGTQAQLAVPLTAEAIRADLDRAMVLEYFLAQDTVFLWALERDTLGMFELGPIDPVLRDVTRAHRLLARGELPPRALLQSLSAALVQPASQWLARHSELRIAPDGLLHYLPFELLSTGASGAQSIAESHLVTYTPSASASHWLAPPTAATVMLAGFADALVETSDAGYERRDLIQRFALEALPRTRQELNALSQQLPGNKTLLFGAEASEKAFRQVVSRGARIVHVAGHTVVDGHSGRGAAIVFSPDEEDDGLLYPEEIAALDVNATLTVLAACRTALIGPDQGGVLASLTGSLLAAGSSAVLATLWDIDDHTASVFVQQFYRQLAQGLAPAEALRQTRRAFRDDPRWQHDTDWAGFVLIGDAPPLVPRPFRLGWLLAAALLLLVLAAIQVRARRFR